MAENRISEQYTAAVINVGIAAFVVGAGHFIGLDATRLGNEICQIVEGAAMINAAPHVRQWLTEVTNLFSIEDISENS